MIVAASQMLVDSWVHSVDRLLTTIIERGLVLPLVISVLLLLLDLASMTVELFKKS